MTRLILGLSALWTLCLLPRVWDAFQPLASSGPLGERALPAFTATVTVLGFLSRSLDREAFVNALWGVSFAALIAIFGWKEGALLFFLPMAWQIALLLLPSLPWRLALTGAGLGAISHARGAGYDSFGLWWVLGQWLRLASIAFETPASVWREKAISWKSLRSAGLHFFAAPFLFTPVPMEWLPISSFREALENKHEPAGKGAPRLLWTGIGILLLHDFCRSSVEPFRSESWDFARLMQEQGEAWFHLKAGWTFFLLRLWQYCGLTAIVAGSWQLLGIPLRYDFDRPLLSRNGFDFWRRYHNYGREFLLRNIFYPTAFALSRRLPWTVSAGIAGVAVFAMVVIVQATSVVPIAGIPLSRTYSWEGAFHHTFWSFVMIGITSLFSWILARIRIPGRLRAAAEIAFTLTLLGILFYNSFSQLWMNQSQSEFLRRIFPW